MTDAAWLILAAAVAAFAGFGWLALAMDAHWRQVLGSSGPAGGTRHALRLLGAAGLAASGIMCFLADRPSMAALVWIMLMATGAPLVAFTLAWRPRLLRPLWPLGRT